MYKWLKKRAFSAPRSQELYHRPSLALASPGRPTMRNAPAQEQHDIACAQRGLDHAWQVLQQNRPSVSAFPIFVPSLSWQKLGFEHFKGGIQKTFPQHHGEEAVGGQREMRAV